MEFPFPTDIANFILWLGLPGAAGVIGALLLERVAAFRDWKAPAKQYVVIGIFVALPFVSKALAALYASLDPALAAQVQEYLNLAIGGLVAWGASQFAHKADPAA